MPTASQVVTRQARAAWRRGHHGKRDYRTIGDPSDQESTRNVLTAKTSGHVQLLSLAAGLRPTKQYTIKKQTNNQRISPRSVAIVRIGTDIIEIDRIQKQWRSRHAPLRS